MNHPTGKELRKVRKQVLRTKTPAQLEAMAKVLREQRQAIDAVGSDPFAVGAFDYYEAQARKLGGMCRMPALNVAAVVRAYR